MERIMKFLKSFFSASFFSFLLFFLAFCAQPQSKKKAAEKDTPEDSTELTVDNIEFDWGEQAYAQRGVITSVFTTEFVYPIDYWGNFCFENNNPCVRASTEIRDTIRNNPVGIQGFQLNFHKPAGTTITITSASVTTAEPRVDGQSGKFFFYDRHVRKLHGTATCDLNDSNAVGLETPVVGSERILSGLYLYDEGSPTSTGGYENMYLRAGRIWYSGFVPYASTGNTIYRFQFLPQTEAATVDFGNQSYSESSSGMELSQKFGLDQNYVNTVNADGDSTNNIGTWESHMVIGFCITGTKTVNGVTRPLLLGSRTRTYKPEMKLISQ